MTKFNAENERTKRRYFSYLKEAKRHSEQTVDATAKALARFEEYHKHKSFKAFHLQQAIAFKNHLAQQTNVAGTKLSKATLHATLANLKRFFQWLSGQPGYKSRFQYSDADYFNLSENDVRVATAKREQKVPTLEQVRHAISRMPASTDIERRNQAVIAFTVLTGARDSAIASMKIKHVNLQDRTVYQDAREVRTKFAKTFTTTFFPVGDPFQRIVEEWMTYLREVKLCSEDAPLFPATQVGYQKDSGEFGVNGLDRKGWSTTTPIRKIFQDAFESAGLPYFYPHSFRHMLVRLGETLCPTIEAFKAWSQNLGHENARTTLYSYGEVPAPRQREIILHLGQKSVEQKDALDVDALASAIAVRLTMQHQSSPNQ